MPYLQIKSKRIVFFAPESLPSFAGAGLNAHAFAMFLTKHAKKVTLCCLNYNNQLPKLENKGKLYVKRLPYYNKSAVHKLLSFPPLLKQYYLIIRQADIILIYSGYLIGFQFIICLAYLMRRKVIFRSTLIGGDDPESLLSKNFIIRQLNKFVLKRLNIYFAINPSFASQFKTTFQNKIKIVESYQGVDAGRFYPCKSEYRNQIREKIKLPPDNLIILSVGILLKKKGFHLVFPALAKLDLPFKYIIAGDYLPSAYHKLSSLEKKEMQTIHEEGMNILGENVKFVGPVSNIEDYYHASDIFLMPSLQEGTPNVLLEAMACGLPCVTSKLVGLAGNLTLHTINSLEFNKPEILSKLISDLAKDPEQMVRIGLNAAQTIAENCTFKKVASKLFSFLNEEGIN
jgi:glycosyltransferase involved in cell wall biosynthesis